MVRPFPARSMPHAIFHTFIGSAVSSDAESSMDPGRNMILYQNASPQCMPKPFQSQIYDYKRTECEVAIARSSSPPEAIIMLSKSLQARAAIPSPPGILLPCSRR